MRSYLKIWVALGVPVLVAGTAVALVDSPGATALLFSFGAVAGVMVQLDRQHALGEKPSRPRRARRAIGPALLAGLLLTGGLGLAMVDAQLFLGIVLVAAITSPPVVGLFAGGGHRPLELSVVPDDVIDLEPSFGRISPPSIAPARLAVALDIEATLAELPALSDLEVCRAWRRSFVLLDATISSADRLAIVQLREAYLDELGRRSPRALQAWFDAGGRAASGPDKFFREAS